MPANCGHKANAAERGCPGDKCHLHDKCPPAQCAPLASRPVSAPLASRPVSAPLASRPLSAPPPTAPGTLTPSAGTAFQTGPPQQGPPRAAESQCVHCRPAAAPPTGCRAAPVTGWAGATAAHRGCLGGCCWMLVLCWRCRRRGVRWVQTRALVWRLQWLPLLVLLPPCSAPPSPCVPPPEKAVVVGTWAGMWKVMLNFSQWQINLS